MIHTDLGLEGLLEEMARQFKAAFGVGTVRLLTPSWLDTFDKLAAITNFAEDKLPLELWRTFGQLLGIDEYTAVNSKCLMLTVPYVPGCGWLRCPLNGTGVVSRGYMRCAKCKSVSTRAFRPSASASLRVHLEALYCSLSCQNVYVKVLACRIRTLTVVLPQRLEDRRSSRELHHNSEHLIE